METSKDVVLNLEDRDLPPDSDDRSYKDDTSLTRDSIDKEHQSVKFKNCNERSEVDSPAKHSYASKKNVAEGMMDIALLTANANQLRFLITYNSDSKTFYFSVCLIVLSLVLQVAVGIALIFKRQMKNRGKRDKLKLTNDFLVGGVFIVTVINVFVASFTTTDSPKS